CQCTVFFYFFFQAEDGIRDRNVTGVQTCALPILLLVAGHFGGPVQQGDVQHTVDDKAVVVGVVHGAPRLQEAAAGLVAGQQLVGGGDGGVTALFAAHQLPGRHAGGAVQKAHVVVVHRYFAPDAVGKAVHLHQGGFLESLVAGGLVGQPDLAGPEAAGPLIVGAAG